ncbi:MAG: hypothetical protein Q9220_001003 [cf. Caloplaca sp. 1 TL-2023]
MNMQRAEYQADIYSLPPPPPPPEMSYSSHHNMRGPPEHHHLNGDSWRPQVPQSARMPQAEFTFRNGDTASQYPQNGDHYRPAGGRELHGRKPANSARHRGRGPRWATAARPLLSSKRENSPENLLAQEAAQDRAQRFLPADDVSDSEEEAMEESDADEVSVPDGTPGAHSSAAVEELSNGLNLEEDATIIEPPTKRRATTSAVKDAELESSLPKWSNPDPYTVLPPVDEVQRKRKDVVKIIRKARISVEMETVSPNQVSANDDFISFGGNTPLDDNSRSLSPTELNNTQPALLPRAPTGPRAFSHRDNLHGDTISGAPGTSKAMPSIKDLGPPPDLGNQSRTEFGRGPEGHIYYPDQAEALGNRKRTLNDDIKGDSVAKANTRKTASNGSVLRQLHKEICDFYNFVKPQRHEQTVREDLLQRVQVAVDNYLPGCNVHCFGSFAAKMYLPTADMDLVVISPTFRTIGQRVVCQSNSAMHRFCNNLERFGIAQSGSAEAITHAKVPLVKFVDRKTTIRVDISFENETGLVANDTFNTWKRQFPAMPVLTTVIKQFLMMRGLNEVVNGGLGGFSVTCLVTSLLQNLPRVQSGEVIPEQHLGETLLEFLDLYGNQFDLARTGILMNPPGYYDKQAVDRSQYRNRVYQANKGDRLAIIDPNKSDNDISGGSRNVGLIFDSFSKARGEILKAMRSRQRISLLDWCLGGNYQSFSDQRQILQGLYDVKDLDVAVSEVAAKQIRPQTNNNSNDIDIAGKEEPPKNDGLPSHVFANPVDPNVVIPPMVRKLKPRKARKQQKESSIKPLTSNGESKVPMKNGEDNREHARARRLKDRFPAMEKDIPQMISKKKRAKLEKRFSKPAAQPVVHLQATKGMKENTRKGGAGKAKKNRPSKARLAETARNLGGGNNIPIMIG